MVPAERVAAVTGTLLLLAAGVLIGFGLSSWRRRRPGATARAMVHAATPHLLPDPALEWLRRASGAMAVWAVEAPTGGTGQAIFQSSDPATGPEAADLEAIEGRLAGLRDKDGAGTERLDSGTLLYHAAGGTVVAMLLPAAADGDRLARAKEDLVFLLDGVARRPVLHDLAQVRATPSTESVGSIGMRLAYQIERIVNEEAIVALREPAGVRIVGVSGLGDRRLLESVLPPGAVLSQVAMGETEETEVEDPIGGVVADRRRHDRKARVLPIIFHGQALGAVAYRNPAGAAVPGPVLFEVQEAVREAGPRIDVATQLATRQERATKDPLTGLRNRRGLDDQLSMIGAQRGTLIAADLDRFKLLNDTLGHAAGDAALVHFARVVLEQIRGGDVAARVGGEEFLIWLPGTPLEEGSKVAERIRRRLGTMPWDWQGRSWPLSSSFGVAACPETSASRENLAGQADAALYEAKRGGRDRVEVWRRKLGLRTED